MSAIPPVVRVRGCGLGIRHETIVGFVGNVANGTGIGFNLVFLVYSMTAAVLLLRSQSVADSFPPSADRLDIELFRIEE